MKIPFRWMINNMDMFYYKIFVRSIDCLLYLISLKILETWNKTHKNYFKSGEVIVHVGVVLVWWSIRVDRVRLLIVGIRIGVAVVRFVIDKVLF